MLNQGHVKGGQREHLPSGAIAWKIQETPRARETIVGESSTYINALERQKD